MTSAALRDRPTSASIDLVSSIAQDQSSSVNPLDVDAPEATVRIARTRADEDAVFRLRYDVYVAEQGKPGNADDDESVLIDDLDARSYCWMVIEGSGLVGTLRGTPLNDDLDTGLLPPGLGLDSLPSQERLAADFSSRLAITPRHRGSWVFKTLVQHAYAHSRATGVRCNLMMTNIALVPLFERLGYVRYGASAHSGSAAGLLVPMLLPSCDLRHLTAVRSPYLPIARRLDHDEAQLPRIREAVPLIDRLYAQDAHSRIEDITARVGLSSQAALVVAQEGFTHYFEAGSLVQRRGDRVTALFVPLDATVVFDEPRVPGPMPERGSDGAPRATRSAEVSASGMMICLPLVSLMTRIERSDGGLRDELRSLVAKHAAAFSPMLATPNDARTVKG